MTDSVANRRLTGRRERRQVESDEFGQFADRIVRAYGRRIGQGDVEALRGLIALGDRVNESIDDAVDGLRSHGYSWAEIASRLGTTRQNAWQRWGKDSGSGGR